MILVMDGISHILEVDESIANTRTEASVEEQSAACRYVQHTCNYLQNLFRNGQSASSVSRNSSLDLPIRKYMKSYFPALVSSTIALSMAL